MALEKSRMCMCLVCIGVKFGISGIHEVLMLFFVAISQFHREYLVIHLFGKFSISFHEVCLYLTVTRNFVMKNFNQYGIAHIKM